MPYRLVGWCISFACVAIWQNLTLVGRKICVSGLLQFPCCIAFHFLAFAALGMSGLPVDDRPLAGFIIPASCNILQHLIPGILTAMKARPLGTGIYSRVLRHVFNHDRGEETAGAECSWQQLIDDGLMVEACWEYQPDPTSITPWENCGILWNRMVGKLLAFFIGTRAFCFSWAGQGWGKDRSWSDLHWYSDFSRRLGNHCPCSSKSLGQPQSVCHRQDIHDYAGHGLHVCCLCYCIYI